MDSISAPRPVAIKAPSGLRGWRQALASRDWLRRGTAARRRRWRLDRLRVGLLGVLGAIAAAAAAAVWTWQHHQRRTNAAALTAMAFVERRLSAIDQELSQVSRHTALPAPLEDCPPDLVATLLRQSLQSGLVRRFDVVQVDEALRCEPGGTRQGRPLADTPPQGLSIVPGGQTMAKPMVLRTLAGGTVLQATLDPHALTLPRGEMPVSLQNHPMRIVVQSPPAGTLQVWDSRPRPGATPPAIVSDAVSGRYNFGARAQVDQGDLLASLAWTLPVAVAIAMLVIGSGIAWFWRLTLSRSRLSHRLRRALRKREFLPFVQPIVELSSGRCIGAEILMRWDHPQRGILAPGEFIEEAERTGLILGMSDLTMTMAARQLAALSKVRPDAYFTFNITPSQLREPDFARRLGQIFGPNTLPRHQVMLELTEREFVDPQTQGVLSALRAEGWRIAMDDFGTGHSSLASIENLVVDRIKIDRAFVKTVDEQTTCRPVLDAIIGMARELRVPLVAEGIETQAQWDYLAARGVACAQGFLIARPMPVADFVRWMGERHPELDLAARQPRSTNAPGGASAPAAVDPTELWQRLGSAGGLEICDRLHRLRVYRQCFVGSAAVDWIVRECAVGRVEAVRLGRDLLASGLITHVAKEHDFEDEALFYRLTPPDSGKAAVQTPAAADLAQAVVEAADLPWRDHSRGLLRHHRCVPGRSIVDWIVGRYGAPREVAIQWARQLMRQGTLRHVTDSRPFRDDRTLYRLG